MKIQAGQTGRAQGAAWDNSAVLVVMRSCLADVGTWRASVAPRERATHRQSRPAQRLGQRDPLDAGNVPLEECQRVSDVGDLVGRREGLGEPLARVEQAPQLEVDGGAPLARHVPRLRIQDEIRHGGLALGGLGCQKEPPDWS